MKEDPPLLARDEFVANLLFSVIVFVEFEPKGFKMVASRPAHVDKRIKNPPSS